MQLEIDVRPDAGRHIITPRGEIDLATQGQLKAVIEDLVLDLDQTTFLDSTGLGVLIGARRKAHAFKGSFAIVCSRRELLKLFRITSLDKVFTIHEADHALEVADGHGAGS